MTDWQPIETAPKDGTSVIIWPKNGARPVFAFYKRPWYYRYLLKKYKDVGSSWRSLYTFVSPYHPGQITLCEQSSTDAWLCQETEPTHWMALPEPPEISSVAADIIEGLNAVLDDVSGKKELPSHTVPEPPK